MTSLVGIFWRVALSFIVLFSAGALSVQASVNVRFADHPSYSRIVFDWQQVVDYTAVLKDGKLEIVFEKPEIPQWNGLTKHPLEYLSKPQYRIEGENLIVTLTVKNHAQLKHFRDRAKIVFDVIGDEETSSIPAALQENKPEREEIAKPPAQEPLTQESIDHPTALDGNDLVMQVTRNGENIRLSYPWKQNVRAAAFIRDNRLWVVFEGKKNIDQHNLDRYIGQKILSFQQMEDPAMTILTYEIMPGQNIKAQKINTQWHIDLKNSETAPTIPIQNGHQRRSDDKGEDFFFAVENTNSVVNVRDPVIGDEIAIIPVMDSSHGVLRTQKFAQFESLATAQGVAIKLIADNLNILKYRNGVSVSSKDGLAISRSLLSTVMGEPLEGQEGKQSSRKLIDFYEWKKGPLEDNDDYYANKHELLYKLVNSTDTDRNDVRWKIAKFYLANDRTREAYGVLKVMLDSDANLIENPEYRTVLGITNILMRRFKEGANLLVHKSLFAEQDIFLWRSVAHSALGEYEKAFDEYQKGSDVLALQENDDKVRFLFASIHSAYALKKPDSVREMLQVLRNLTLNIAQLTELDYWQALIDRDSGDLQAAEERLQHVVKAGVRQTEAWAKLDLVNMEYKSKKIDATQAIDQLEKLRFAWRGDDFELDLLTRLADLYVEQKEFYTGLQTLKSAVTFFKESKRTSELTKKMSMIYRDLFLLGEADKMDPVKAVSLYSEFRELIPLGTDGDNMTRRLADRLVSIDLLEEAAELLKYQIEFRLKGVAQSVVATRLAMIYLLDSKPKEALGILRATRDSQIPDDIEDRRKMIEVRTLIELGSYEEAEVILEEYHTPEAEDLRSDVYWKSENWSKYITHGNMMLANRFQDDKQLSPAERLAVLRLSVAYVISDDKAGVKILRNRYKSHMDNGLYGDTFEVITAEKQLTDQNVRRLTKSIASVGKLETFMDSYRAEFTKNLAQN